VRAEALDGTGWFLLRASVHDPVLVLNAQSDLPGGTAPMLRDVLGVFGGLPIEYPSS